jgi:hypothetical protein
MSLTLKVLGGTKPDVRLCDSCRYGAIITDSTNTEHVFCAKLYIAAHSGIGSEYRYTGMIPGELPLKIVECSQYADKKAMTEHEAAQIGWVLEIDDNKKPMGFKPPDQKDGRGYFTRG